MVPHPSTNFDIHKYQNKPRFNGFYLRNNLPKIKDEPYVILDSFVYEECNVGGSNHATCFDSFGV